MSPTVLADISEVDVAVMNRLSADATLMGIVPGGVFWDVAGAGATKFVIVSQLDHEPAYAMPHQMWDRITYLIKATVQGTSGSEVKSAAKRIHELFEGAVITPTGYYPSMNCQRAQRVRYTEVDEVTDQRWQHRGGHYELMVCPK